MDPSATSLMGVAGLVTVLSSLSTWQIRSADAWEMMHMTKTMDSIIMAMRICMA